MRCEAPHCIHTAATVRFIIRQFITTVVMTRMAAMIMTTMTMTGIPMMIITALLIPTGVTIRAGIPVGILTGTAAMIMTAGIPAGTRTGILTGRLNHLCHSGFPCLDTEIKLGNGLRVV